MTRDTVLGRNSVLKAIYSEYQDLKYYGYTARYEVHQFTKEDYQTRYRSSLLSRVTSPVRSSSDLSP